jgi:hypothetical protein
MSKGLTATSIAALAFAANLAIAGEPQPPVPPQGAAADSAQGLRVVRDKETGALRLPNAEELEAMLQQERAQSTARGASAAPAGPAEVVVRRHPDGSVSAVLPPEFLVSFKAQRGEDGKLTYSHGHPAHEHPTSAHSQNPTQ